MIPTQDRNGLINEMELLRNRGVPAGTIMAFAGAAEKVPEGWLLCDGRALSKGDRYLSLWEMIGENWGDGCALDKNGAIKLDAQGKPIKDGDFNLPDLRGYFLRGVDDPDGPGEKSPANRDAESTKRKSRTGREVGGVVGSLQGDAFRKHSHSIPNFRSSHGQLNGGQVTSGGEVVKEDITNIPDTNATGNEHETRPKNAYVNFIIKY